MALRLASQEHGEGPPLVILHGLFGSARNWTAIARRLGEGHRVHTLDLRNHGASPWSDRMGYSDMAADVAAYIDERGLGPTDLMGHSMGGKAAMAVALLHPAAVSRLVVVDVAPVAYPPVHMPLIAAMRSIDLTHLTRRGAVEEALRAGIPDITVRQFLLQNLVQEDGGLRWRVNLRALAADMPDIAGFPELPTAAPYRGPALFLAGDRSDYLRRRHHAAIRRLFPAAEFDTLAEAGHWVHADQPEAFIRRVRIFLARPHP